jgi:hypothetical protein
VLLRKSSGDYPAVERGAVLARNPLYLARVEDLVHVSDAVSAAQARAIDAPLQLSVINNTEGLN